MLLLRNGTIITGDGKRVLEDHSLAIEGNRIIAIGRQLPAEGREVVDLAGDYLLPGLINHHAHGCTMGPLFASGSPPLSRAEVLANLDKQLQGGVTTVLNVDGFAAPEEVEVVNAWHPLTVKTATSHSPANIEAALAVDGQGLGAVHRQLTMAEMWEWGAVAVGEVGSGHTLGGGGQEYMYIPLRVREETGISLTPRQARRLKEAVLGRYLDVEKFDREGVDELLKEWGLEDKLTAEGAAELVRESVLPSLVPAREGIREAAIEARLLGAPLIVHNAAPTKELLQELARQGGTLVAAHSNHDSFTPGEALAQARHLRREGAIIDIATFDAFGARETTPAPEHFFAFLEYGQADLISTDYGGGKFDPPLVGVKAALERGLGSLPDLVAKLTSRVAQVFPRLAPERGVIEEGKIADLIVVSRQDVALVKQVYIGGRLVLGRR
ncbi:MAG: amidohydrolase family protein [bacterium]|jgi:imidazolonepropionase-like amidohydrolase